MYCKNCGTKIKKDELYCTGCGNSLSQKNETETKEDSIVGLVLAIISCLFFWCAIISIPLAIIAIILTLTKKEKKIAPIIISSISILLSILIIGIIVWLISIIPDDIDSEKIENKIYDSFDKYHERFDEEFEKRNEEKTSIKGYIWETDSNESIYFNQGNSYSWYKDKEDKTTKYTKGTYDIYNGESAIWYIKTYLKEYNMDEKVQRSIIEENGYKVNNYYVIILNQKDSEPKGENKSIYYYGFIKENELDLTNIADSSKLHLYRKEKITSVDI